MNFGPSNCKAEGENTNFVADGYGGKYYVLNQKNVNPGTITVKGARLSTMILLRATTIWAATLWPMAARS